jgi:hypothetical protein
MKIIRHGTTGYTMYLSAQDTCNWATCPGKRWPCSRLAGHHTVVQVDRNGLFDFSVTGSQSNGPIENNELEACVADHLPADLRRFWPTWKEAFHVSAQTGS